MIIKIGDCLIWYTGSWMAKFKLKKWNKRRKWKMANEPSPIKSVMIASTTLLCYFNKKWLWFSRYFCGVGKIYWSYFCYMFKSPKFQIVLLMPWGMSRTLCLQGCQLLEFRLFHIFPKEIRYPDFHQARNSFTVHAQIETVDYKMFIKTLSMQSDNAFVHFTDRGCMLPWYDWCKVPASIQWFLRYVSACKVAR